MYERRLFVGLPVTPAMRKRLSRESGKWEHLPLSIVSPENLHITLLLLGFVPEVRMPEVCERLSEALSGIEPFEVAFEKIVTQPEGPLEEAKTVQFSGAANESLLDLHNRIGKALAFFIEDRRSFRPHITLAWMKRGLWKRLPEQPILDKPLSLIDSVDSVVLYESVLEKGEHRYIVIDEYPLEG